MLFSWFSTFYMYKDMWTGHLCLFSKNSTMNTDKHIPPQKKKNNNSNTKKHIKQNKQIKNLSGNTQNQSIDNVQLPWHGCVIITLNTCVQMTFWHHKVEDTFLEFLEALELSSAYKDVEWSKKVVVVLHFNDW